ncbi:MAG: hypothetical protein K8U57_00500 [Planctomycetes bacterium]|nr:hypothetical protein [Planctomycetota bacterium]
MWVIDSAEAECDAALIARNSARSEQWQLQGQLLLAVVGPEWKFRPKWRTTEAVALAAHCYQNRDWSVMPILADALEEAGCSEPVLLADLRSPKSQWCRGCRILDELLQKR